LQLITPQKRRDCAAVENFAEELNNRLQSEFLSDDDPVSFFPSILHLIHSFIDSFVGAEMEICGSEDQILRDLDTFFHKRVLQAFNETRSYHDPSDFQLMLEILQNKAVHFRELCQEILRKHKSSSNSQKAKSTKATSAEVKSAEIFEEIERDLLEGFELTSATSADENEYICLALRVGIDVSKPEQLFDHPKELKDLGIDSSNPEFQKFVNVMSWTYAARSRNLGAAQEFENDENVDPSFALPQPKSKKPRNYVLKNGIVAKKLEFLLSNRDFLSQLKLLLTQTVDISELVEAYLEVIVKVLKEFVSGPEFYNAIPAGGTGPLKAHTAVAARLTKACVDFDMEMLGGESMGVEVAKQVSAWLSSTLFASEAKSTAVERWTLSVGSDKTSSASHSPASKKDDMKVSFAQDEEVTKFTWFSSPQAIKTGAAVTSASSEIRTAKDAVPPFPLNNPMAALTTPEYMRYTRDYYVQHGNLAELKMHLRREAIEKALPKYLSEAFADVDHVTQDQIFSVLQSSLKATP
jgi:hypothetical protein